MHESPMGGAGRHIPCAHSVDGTWGGVGWGKQTRQKGGKSPQTVAPAIPPA